MKTGIALHGEVRDGAIVVPVDSAGLVPVEIQTSPLMTQFVLDKVKSVTDVGFIGEAIKDALFINEYQALARFCAAYILTERVRIAAYGEPGGSGNRINDHERHELSAYLHAAECLTLAARQFMLGNRGFCALVNEDVGRSKKRRSDVNAEVRLLGSAVINREDKTRCSTACVAYLRAASQVLNEGYLEYSTICQRKSDQSKIELHKHRMLQLSQNLTEKVRELA